MKEKAEVKKFTTLMRIHLGMMIVITAVLLVLSVLAYTIESDKVTAPHLVGGFLGVSAISLVFGIIYLCNNYKKSAVGFYRLFMLLGAAANMLGCFVTVASRTQAYTVFIFMAKTVIFIILGLCDDLGKKVTWIIYGAVFLLDIAYIIFFAVPEGMAGLKIGLTAVRLLTDGSIGLAIKGKFEDKKIRDSKDRSDDWFTGRKKRQE